MAKEDTEIMSDNEERLSAASKMIDSGGKLSSNTEEKAEKKEEKAAENAADTEHKDEKKASIFYYALR